MRALLLILWALSFNIQADDHDHDHGHKHLGAHEHGHITVEMAIDGKQVGLELRGPAESFIGFEHKAKTKAEKKKLNDAEELLKKKASSLFVFAPELKCVAKNNNVEWQYDEGDHDDDHKEHKDHKDHKKEEKHHATHAELKASYQFECGAAIAKTKLKLAVKKNFSKVQEIQIAVLPSNGAAFAITSKENEVTIDIP